MKLKEGFILRQIGEKYVVVAVGAAAKNFNGMITLNSTGALLFNLAKENVDEIQFKNALLSEYSGQITEEIALRDAKSFIQKLVEAGLLK